MRFRKSINIMKGVRLNFSKSGVSLTVGGKGVSTNIGKKGVFLNTSIPGTGLYDRKKIADFGDDYFCVSEPFAAEKYGICFRKADAEMCKQVEEAFMQLVEDGTYVSLAEKYGLDTANLCLAK